MDDARIPHLQQRWVKIVPHLVDTLLLASAVALAVMSHQYPLANGWLTAKVAGLLIYIGARNGSVEAGENAARARHGMARRAGRVLLYRRGRAHAPTVAVAGIAAGILPVRK